MAAASEAEPEIDIVDEDVFNIIYSNGTTGLPKGIIHTHYIRAMYATMYAAYRIHPESVIVHAGSIIFNGAFLTLMPAFYLGATYILLEYFNPDELIKTIHREKVTHIKMVPSQIIGLLHSPEFSAKKLHSLEMLGSVGAPLLEYKKELHKRLPRRFYELYGLTEGFMTVLDKYDFETKPNSVGVPPPFMEMRIITEDRRDTNMNEIGEIVACGPMLMPSYYKQPELPAQAIREGWLYSGDLGYVDEDGYLYLVDRKKDMIISGGVNVYSPDIEEIIVQHDQVQEVAVFGVPDDKWGETPISAITPPELKDWINQRVDARYQRVHDVIFLGAFPRSTAGKTLKLLTAIFQAPILPALD